MSEKPLTITILPVSVEVDGAIVHILEILKSRMPGGKTVYHAICKIDFNGITTRNFDITFKTEEEFKEKLRTEVAKLKLMNWLYGKDFLAKVVSR
ncbi:MAG: hypothetical protein DRP01_03245 [Archaeoglobales archaeon]|nr:MAG: hypothetical protein DRP01_03245 [Archaeoglobales archaeon]